MNTKIALMTLALLPFLAAAPLIADDEHPSSSSEKLELGDKSRHTDI